MESLKAFRDRFDIPIGDDELENVPYYRPPPDSPEMRYMRERRAALGGLIPARRAQMELLETPPLTAFGTQLKSSGTREISTTMAFVRMLSSLVKDADIGQRVVPIVPDEARTFGMEGMFRQLGIYSSVGQRYTPEDAGQIMFYKEDIKGQILEEGINEAGAFSAWLAAATSYSTSAYPDGAVLHFLLHVRFPAHRRPGLGGGRQPGARVPDRRHGGAHHAQRRGPAAPGRPQPPAGGHDSQLRQLRPGLCL